MKEFLLDLLYGWVFILILVGAVYILSTYHVLGQVLYGLLVVLIGSLVALFIGVFIRRIKGDYKE